MQKQVSSNGLLIVVELGAEWPSALQAELAVPARRVFAQEESESCAAFARRVGEQLDGLFARGVALGSAFIVCSERTDDAARAARSELARAAAGALARGTGGHLQLIASDRNEGRSRAPLTTLARELASEWQSAAIATELRFIPDAECVSAPLVSAGSSEPSARSAKRGRGKDSARRVA
jgi:hypothetical protein